MTVINQYEVCYSKGKFKLELYKTTMFRSFVVSAADTLCVVLGHRFCNKLVTPAVVWEDKRREYMLSIDITRAQADDICGADKWEILDDKD